MIYIKKLGQVIIPLLFVTTYSYAQSFDIYLKGAQVYDGSGGESKMYDVGIVGEKIQYFGPPKKSVVAKKIIQADGLVLAPGFIDPHTHYISQLNHKEAGNRAVLRALAQGVTTVFEGNDGTSPLSPQATFEKWEANGIGPNAALFIGHNTIRREVLGTQDVQPTTQELDKMRLLVKQAMEEGAFGLSTGLFYNPGNFATIDEVIELCKVAHQFGGIHDTHQRDEGSQNIGVVNSTKEILEIGKRSGIKTHFSHIKVAGPQAWGLSSELIKLIESARSEGLDVTANQYPYIASRTGLSSALVPAWVRDGGVKAMRERFKNPELIDSILNGIRESIQARTADASMLFLYSPQQKYHNKSLQTVANDWNITPEEAVVRICATSSPSVHSFMMKEDDLLNFMVKPWVMIGSDGGGGHPRSFGSFARILEYYTLQKNVLSLSEAIYKSSHLTAKTLNIKNRGLIKEGYYGDIMLFDPKTIKANSNWENGEVLATGVKYVLVNGKLAIEDGNWTKLLNGKPLKLID